MSFIYIFILQITLQSNINDNASELKTYFSKEKDATFIECKFNISKVEIYNNGYRNTIYNSDKDLSFNNDSLPPGRNTISVFTNKKIIVFNIIKKKPYVEVLYLSLKDVKGFDSLLPTASTDINLDLEIDPNNRLVVGYWIVEDIRTSFGSHRSEFLSDLKYTEYLIRKNKIDITTKNGRLNRLSVIEIYDLRGFMDLRAEGSYNKKPYYKTKKDN